MTATPIGAAEESAKAANCEIRAGFPESARPDVAALYWDAFANKLGRVMRPRAKALRFFSDVADPRFAFSAVSKDGTFLGAAGFKTPDGAFVGGGMRELAKAYGWLGAAWRGPLLALLERENESGLLLMDGIFVRPEARGRGAGGALLDAVCAEAERRGLRGVRLDVIDDNARARALYERKGFTPTKKTNLGPLRVVFGFSSATTMVKPTTTKPENSCATLESA